MPLSPPLLARAIVVALLATPVLIAACSSDEPSDKDAGFQYPESCMRLIDACHYKDPQKPGRINDCHNAGHEGEASACEAAVADGCVDDCEAAPIPNFGEEDASASDAAGTVDAMGGDGTAPDVGGPVDSALEGSPGRDAAVDAPADGFADSAP